MTAGRGRGAEARHRVGRRLSHARWRAATLARAGLIAPLRPDRYARMGLVVRRYGISATTGLGLAAARRPDGVGLVDELGSLTWGELGRRSDALASGIARMRTPSGREIRTIAILCRNHRGFVDALGAATKLGADALLLNTGFSGPQLADVVAREQAELVIYDEEFADLVEHARTEVGDLVELVAWQDQPGGDVRSLDSVIRAGDGARPPKAERPAKVILLTSGTTGTPKGAARGADGGTDAMAAMLDRIPWRAGETVVVAAPMFHAWGFGQLVIAATLACTVVTRRRFDPEATLEMVRSSGATGLGVVPVMIERIMELPAEVLDRYPLEGRLRFVTASGSRMRGDAVLAFMDRFGDTIYNSYNATEAGLISTAVPADLRVAPDTAGKPVVGTELRILDDADREVPQGEVGRITVRSGFQFSGYTSGDGKAFLGGYMVSGDVGRVDEAGRLYVVGRDDEMIVSGGENVYPLEVEETLNAHPAVREAAVVGVDDERFGQRLAAYVALEAGAEVGADDLREHVKSQLAGYKVPRDVVLVDELPRNASGKIMKRELPGSPGPRSGGH
jgi:acyl-CoA synthetase (AMP-forming)/AMP-acid ligase II